MNGFFGVSDVFSCLEDKNQSYALYVPLSYFTAPRPLPVLFFFDAHAQGSLPVRRYKELAEKYGFAFAASNISKNGMDWNATSFAANMMMSDLRSKVNIDPNRIYTCGFSGGSRVASSIAISNTVVSGVIGCSAGFPPEMEVQRKFDYIAIAGDYDINWIEMQQLDRQLETNHFTHQLLTFPGIHSWPPAEDFETALLWLQVNAMKNHVQPVNDTMISTLKKDYDKRIATAENEDDLVKAEQLLSGTIQLFTGLADASTYQKQLNDLTESAAYKKSVALEGQLIQQEQEQQQELAKIFPDHDVQWWTAKIAELNGKARTAKPVVAAQMYQRVLDYLGMMSYLYTDRALKAGDLANAANYIQIFKLADPKNPDHSYLQAIYYIKTSDRAHAISSLREAAELGYDKVQDLLDESAFQVLHNDLGFKTILERVRANYYK